MSRSDLRCPRGLRSCLDLDTPASETLRQRPDVSVARFHEHVILVTFGRVSSPLITSGRISSPSDLISTFSRTSGVTFGRISGALGRISGALDRSFGRISGVGGISGGLDHRSDLRRPRSRSPPVGSEDSPSVGLEDHLLGRIRITFGRIRSSSVGSDRRSDPNHRTRIIGRIRIIGPESSVESEDFVGRIRRLRRVPSVESEDFGGSAEVRSDPETSSVFSEDSFGLHGRLVRSAPKTR